MVTIYLDTKYKEIIILIFLKERGLKTNITVLGGNESLVEVSKRESAA